MSESCKCDDFNDGTKLLNSALFQLKNHGGGFEIKPFVYCPWCGGMAPKPTEAKPLEIGMEV